MKTKYYNFRVGLDGGKDRKVSPNFMCLQEGNMFLNRVIGVLKLDVNTYEEIEADETATSQAAIVVAIVAIVGGILGGIFAAFTDASFLGTFFRQLITAFVSWFIWAYVTYWVGTSIFEGKSTPGEMLRVLGFAQAPGILAIIPICGGFIGWIWTLVCTFIAIRQGLDLDNTKALMTAVIAFVVVIVFYFIVVAILAALGFGAAMGLGFLDSLFS